MLLGDFQAGLRYYERGLEVCAKTGFRPETATIRLHQAEVLLQQFPEENATAQEHLDFAIEEFRAMKMQPSLEQALQHKGLLHA